MINNARHTAFSTRRLDGAHRQSLQRRPSGNGRQKTSGGRQIEPAPLEALTEGKLEDGLRIRSIQRVALQCISRLERGFCPIRSSEVRQKSKAMLNFATGQNRQQRLPAQPRVERSVKSMLCAGLWLPDAEQTDRHQQVRALSSAMP